MRRIATLLLLLLCTAACQRKEAVDPANDLVGTWRLTTYCRPNATGSCDDVKVPANKHVYISFSNELKFNETYEGTIPVEYGFLGCGGGSYWLDGDELRILASCMSSTYGRPYHFRLTNQQLVLENLSVAGEYVFEKHSPKPR